MQKADKAAQNSSDNAAKYQEWTTTLCNDGLETVKEVQLLQKAFNWMEQSCSYKGCVSKSYVQN